MKIFISILLLTVNVASFCQGASSIENHFLPTNKWDINKFVWSHIKTEKIGKKRLDYNGIDEWETLDNVKLSISPDGNYYAYSTYKGDIIYKSDQTLIIQSTTNDWKKSFRSKKAGFFSLDNKQYVFQDNDVLNFVQLGTDQIRSINQIKSFKQSTKEGVKWIAYQMNNSEADLVLQDLLSAKEKKIDHVNSYEFDPSGKWLTCQLKNDQKELLIYNLESGEEKSIQFVESYTLSSDGESMVLKIASTNTIEIKYLALHDGIIKTIWSSTDKSVSINNFSVDLTGRQVLFSLKCTSGNVTGNSIWYYKPGMEKAAMKVNNQIQGIEAGFSIAGSASFTENGNYIQFELGKAQNNSKPASDAVMVDVWNYKDNMLQSAQMMSANAGKTYIATINPASDGIIRLERENEKLSLLKGDFAIITKECRIGTDRFWEIKNQRDSVWLVSLKSGDRQLLPINRAATASMFFSPQGKYLLYLDCIDRCHYYSVDLATGKKIKISRGIPDWKLGSGQLFNRPVEKPSSGCGIGGWLKGDNAVLVYDDYDIWQLDLTGTKAALCITNEYGRKHKILFSLRDNDRNRNTKLLFQPNDTLLLTAFNRTDKYSGFYRIVLGVQGEPQLLSMEPAFYYDLVGATDVSFHPSMKPIRALRANTWIVQRESATEATNYFVTNDFKKFKRLTHIQSHKNYNWLTSELHSFKQLDGTISHGVLYKPENFDPSKKYPVIISFYSQLSGSVHQFAAPQYIECAELIGNQPWMVSHGYLVFFPDVYFTKGQWGPSVVNSVVGAANYLSQLPYVDSKRLGACGHSNGGRFGYYLFTHSNCFAAMSVGSSTTDIISNGLKMEEDGSSRMFWAEQGYPNGGIGELWENKGTWIDHTSVFDANKVTCPLLIFQSKQDPSYMQAFEMFTSLRRLEKENWWLQYDNGNHRLNSFGGNINELKDYTIRYTQYWDHFLKDAPAPKWMTQGIPNNLKGLESRLDLDPAGSCASSGKHCAICEAWNKQYKRTPAMFKKPISEWKLDDDIEAEMNKKETERYNKNRVGEAQRIKENNEKLRGTWKGQPY
jgi:dipeptidyl aminopeptidase/acylaminoacyl peptidase